MLIMNDKCGMRTGAKECGITGGVCIGESSCEYFRINQIKKKKTEK
jgi:hypothetical protein